MTTKEERAAKAKRAAIRRARERGEIPWPAVCKCGRPTHSNAHNGTCVRCWLKTPEGKKYKSEQQRVFQARRRLNQRKIQIVDLCKQVVALSAKDSESAQNVVILQLYQALDKIKGAVALAKE